MNGGTSHLDSFDPKPELTRRHLEAPPNSLNIQTFFPNPGTFLKSPFSFKKYGQSGMEISELYPHIATKADEIALVRSCHGDAFDHAPGMYLRNSGSQFPGRPSLGSWVAYGLGSENQNLPAYVVMSDGAMKSGPGVYSAGFLPAVYQGTVFRSGEYPVLNLASPKGITSKAQRNSLDLIAELQRWRGVPTAGWLVTGPVSSPS
jgi:hypothetical protein